MEERVGVKDTGFKLRVASANGMAVLLGGILPLVIDPKLVHHVRFGPRTYPNWAWVGMAASALTVSILTYVVLSRLKGKAARVACVNLPLIVLSIPVLIVLRPEFPHLAYFGLVVLAALLTLITTWIHTCCTNDEFLYKQELPMAAKLERAKEEVGLWRLILVSALGSYLALLVSWFNLLRDINKGVTSDIGEQFLLNTNAMILISFQSCWFICGVLLEIHKQIRRGLWLLEHIEADTLPESAPRKGVWGWISSHLDKH